MDLNELMAFLEQLEQLKDDVHISYAVMSEVLQEHKVDVDQIESTIIDITGHHPSHLDQAGIHAMVNTINANWDTLSGVLNNDAQRGTALAILRQTYQFYFRGLYGRRRG
ncbi:hypothetical protein [Leptothoe spongobia]|uniref:Uncharacterized protein n=1 Tax=Leptothoe spongobia TAU-MAC 1115 TaxID=1967444 RepID=A0A947DI92_9CYAN|nr:hypothetical protein [Leptothoe spongobia]MBT9317513.1 hypothetical protein [Leptothoe spongobia TAU-MAC 1115]